MRAPAVLNQVRLPPLESLSQFLKKSVHDSPKTLVSVLLQKQGFTHNFLSTSTKNIHILGIKMCYQNWRHTFVLYNLISG